MSVELMGVLAALGVGVVVGGLAVRATGAARLAWRGTDLTAAAAISQHQTRPEPAAPRALPAPADGGAPQTALVVVEHAEQVVYGNALTIRGDLGDRDYLAEHYRAVMGIPEPPPPAELEGRR
jgi:hypothetical protein